MGRKGASCTGVWEGATVDKRPVAAEGRVRLPLDAGFPKGRESDFTQFMCSKC